MDGYTPYQQKIIKRYYANQDRISLQRLAELVTDLYLSQGKKRVNVPELYDSDCYRPNVRHVLGMPMFLT